MDAVALTSDERRFLEELEARGVPYMIVGLTAALMQGANTVTIDIDLWFESTADPRIADAAGLGRFDQEFANAREMMFEGVPTKVLPLDRIVASKRAANRPKDQIVIPALEEALAAIKGDKLKG